MTGVRTAAGEIHAPAVVVCAGLWAGRLLAPLGIEVPVAPDPPPDVLLPPAAGLRPASRRSSTGPTRTYMRPETGNLTIHGLVAYDEVVDPDHYNEGADPGEVLRNAELIAAAVPGHGARALDGRLLRRLRQHARPRAGAGRRARVRGALRRLRLERPRLQARAGGRRYPGPGGAGRAGARAGTSGRSAGHASGTSALLPGPRRRIRRTSRSHSLGERGRTQMATKTAAKKQAGAKAASKPLGLLERLAKGPVICAEGYLFEFERRGYLQAGAFVPEVVLEHPDLVEGLHRDFVHAGSDVVEAFTYYAHRAKMQDRRPGARPRADQPHGAPDRQEGRARDRHPARGEHLQHEHLRGRRPEVAPAGAPDLRRADRLGGGRRGRLHRRRDLQLGRRGARSRSRRSGGRASRP